MSGIGLILIAVALTLFLVAIRKSRIAKFCNERKVFSDGDAFLITCVCMLIVAIFILGGILKQQLFGSMHVYWLLGGIIVGLSILIDLTAAWKLKPSLE